MVLWRLRYKLSLRDLPEMFLIRGIVFSHEAVRDWEAKLTSALAKVCAVADAAGSEKAGTLTRVRRERTTSNGSAELHRR